MIAKIKSTPVLRIAAAALLLIAAAGALWAAYIIVTRYHLPCILRAVTGLYCPGCGSGRALSSLLGGDVSAAFRQNPVFTVLAPLCSVYFIARLADYGATGGNHIDRHIPDKLLIAVFFALLAFGALRNIPISALDCLRPF